MSGKIFDWDKAVEIIRDRKIINCSAGLLEDWGNTADNIFKDGKPLLDTWAYLGSYWATPGIEWEERGETIMVKCFKETESSTFEKPWPQRCLDSLGIEQDVDS